MEETASCVEYMWSYRCFNSLQDWFAHIIFYSSPKFLTIFMYDLWMISNMPTLLVVAMTVTMFHYVITSFQGCQNILLYHKLHSFLILTTRKLSHSKYSDSPIVWQIKWNSKCTLRKWVPNKLGTCNYPMMKGKVYIEAKDIKCHSSCRC